MVGPGAFAMLALAAAFGGPPSAASEPSYAPTWDGPPFPAGPSVDAITSAGGIVYAGPALQVPWTCGQVEYCTQGHGGGSHTGLSTWAWDFALEDGEEIWAASAGTVTHLKIDSNQGGCDPAFSASANYLTIDHGDGTSIAYLHMQGASSPLQVGDVVEVGDLVARVGETGWACGAHLHMQVQEACGSYYCQSVQASFADYGDPVAQTTYEGTNCPVCLAVLDGGETVIDDEDAGCLVRQTSAWWSSYEGHVDHHFYTLATDAAAHDSIATWRFGVSVSGDYLVEVFVPEADADTQNATYVVQHAGGSDEVAIDQSTAKGWQALGTFAFAGDRGESIALGDATGENLEALGRRIAYDAVRFTFVPDAATGGGDTAGGDTAGDTAGGSDAADDTGGVPVPGDDTGGGLDGDPASDGADDGTEGGLPPGFGGGGDDDGCACASAGSREAPPLVMLVMLGALARRRRRR